MKKWRLILLMVIANSSLIAQDVLNIYSTPLLFDGQPPPEYNSYSGGYSFSSHQSPSTAFDGEYIIWANAYWNPLGGMLCDGMRVDHSALCCIENLHLFVIGIRRNELRSICRTTFRRALDAHNPSHDCQLS